MKVSVAYQLSPKTNSTQTAMVMDHFGINFEKGLYEVIPEFDLPISEGDLVCFTGPSGSGKSSLMQSTAQQLNDVLDLDSLQWEEKPLVDLLELSAAKAISLLAACGLGEGRLALRTPAELSEGQRFRFRLAFAFSKRPRWILCDEFTATLDRDLALLIARNVNRLSSRLKIGLLLATTHSDVVEGLIPDLHVECRSGGSVSWSRPDVKKKETIYPTSYGSAKVPSPIGRTSVAGTTAVIHSDSAAG